MFFLESKSDDSLIAFKPEKSRDAVIRPFGAKQGDCPGRVCEAAYGCMRLAIRDRVNEIGGCGFGLHHWLSCM